MRLLGALVVSVLLSVVGCEAEGRHQLASAGEREAPVARPSDPPTLAVPGAAKASAVAPQAGAAEGATLRQASWLPDGRRVIGLLSWGAVIFDPVTQSHRELTPSRRAEAYAAAPRADLIALGADDDVSVFRTSGALVATLPGAWSDGARELFLSPDGRGLAVLVDDRVEVWATDTMRKRRAFQIDPEGFQSLRLTDVDKLVVLDSGLVSVWDVTTGKRLLEDADPGASTLCNAVGPALSPDGRWVAATRDGKTVQIWQTFPFERVATTRTGRPGTSVGAMSMGFTGDGVHLLVTSHERPAWQVAIAVDTWRPVTSPRVLASTHGSLSGWTSHSLSVDGRWALELGAGGEVFRVTEARSGQVLFPGP